MMLLKEEDNKRVLGGEAGAGKSGRGIGRGDYVKIFLFCFTEGCKAPFRANKKYYFNSNKLENLTFVLGSDFIVKNE
jgi:hypothetical protein